MLLKGAAWLAIAFGLFLAVGEFVRNHPNWQWWPFWVVDYIAVVLLLIGGVSVVRTGVAASRWLTGAWGFTCAMFWMSFFGHVGDAMQAGAFDSPREQQLTLIIGVMFALTVVGFAASLAGGRAKGA